MVCFGDLVVLIGGCCVCYVCLLLIGLMVTACGLSWCVALYGILCFDVLLLV